MSEYNLTADQRIEAARLLAEAETTGSPIEQLSATYPGLTPADAYGIQLVNIDRRIRSGSVIAGHKIGLTSLAMQEMLGVDQPDYGHVFDDMIFFEDTPIPTADISQPRIEIELAFVLREALSGPRCNVADVIRATDFVLPAIEIIGSRIKDWKLTLPDTIADNASSAAIVLGGRPTRIDAFDPRGVQGAVIKNGETVLEGRSDAVLGNPLTAVAWLANAVHSSGVVLEPGHIIMSGSLTAAVDIEPGDTITAKFDPLGSVTAIFA